MQWLATVAAVHRWWQTGVRIKRQRMPGCQMRTIAHIIAIAISVIVAVIVIIVVVVLISLIHA